jgi:hypothetical protein
MPTFWGDAPPLKRFIVESFYIAALCVNKEKCVLCMRYFRTSERSFLLSVKLSICKGCVCFSIEIDPVFTLKHNISVFRTQSVFSRFLHHFLAFRHKLTRFSASFLSFFGTICPLFEVIVKAESSRRTAKTMIINLLENTLYSFTVVLFSYHTPR